MRIRSIGAEKPLCTQKRDVMRKKKSRKYKPRNEFRRNNSSTAGGHYNYVFGETETHYKSMGLTTHPRKDIPSYPLHKNPNPKDDRKSYLQLKVLNTKKSYFKPPEKDWSFAKEDMPVVRHRIKEYKKSVNRKPKNWYANKRKRNRKKKK